MSWRRFAWRVRCASVLMCYGYGLVDAWPYAGVIAESFFAEGYTPRDAVLEEFSCA